MRSFAGRDILSLKDFERNEFMHLFEIADRVEPIARNRRNSDMLAHKTLVTAFYQPSTRTRLAHEAAMHRLHEQDIRMGEMLRTKAEMEAPANPFSANSSPAARRMASCFSDPRLSNRFLAMMGPSQLCRVFFRLPGSTTWSR